MILKAVLRVTNQFADPVDTHSLSCCPYRKTIRVKIVDEEEYERQENFFIALGEPKWMERGISGVRFFKKNFLKKQPKEHILNKLKSNNNTKQLYFFSLFLVPFAPSSF